MSTLAAQRGSAPLRGLTSSFSSLSLKTPSGRAFSTTPAALTKTIALHRIPAFPIPDYPLGPRLIYKQSNGGLYATARIRRGNNISSDHKVKTPRAWRPNIHRKRLWSPALGVWVRARLSLRVLRTIRKEGGLDAYVLKSKAARVRDLGPGGWKLRWLVMQTAAVRARFADERARLGVVRPAGVEDEDNTDLVHVLVDGATPGPLSAVSRAIIARRAEAVAADRMAWDMAAQQAEGQEFAFGEEAELAGDEDVRGAGEQVGGTMEELDAAIEEMEKDEAKRP
ncbi:hypothetical protein BN1708_012226, partial [Verticillium longisporum]